MRAILVLFLLGLAVAGTVWLWPRLESDPPVLSGPESIRLGAGATTADVAWSDSGMGLQSVRAFLRIPGEGDAEAREVELHAKRFRSRRPGDPVRPVPDERKTLELDARALGLPEGASELVLEAQDASWSGFGEGNASELVIPIEVDTRPPSVSVVSGLTYVRRGGAALVAYRVDDDAERSGARVGDAFFPGVATENGNHIAIFAIPIEAAEPPRVDVVGIDAFGNERAVRFDARIQPREIPEISIALSERFLDRVAANFEDPDSDGPGATPLSVFQRVNTELRAANEATIAAAIPEPTPRRFEGAFEQMRGSKVTSEFAEVRYYTRNGARVSRARHYGYDLASVARAPITASNAGTVVFAGDNGIYGTLVVIDHGLGVTTLYGHLSSLDVRVGDEVTRGQALGNSGATGLAGGDHLHFAVLVGKTYVDPLEWWDGAWIRDRIEARLP